MFRWLLAIIGLPLGLWQSIVQPGVRVLMYHRVDRLPQYDQLNVTPERFEQHLKILSGTGRVVSLAAAVSSLNDGSAEDGSAESSNGIAITFDDGYLDNLTQALPLLEKYQLPATIFITSRFSDQSERHPRYIDDGQRLHLDWVQLRKLSQHPLITIGSHTLSHPYLQRVSDEVCEQEIIESKERIEAELGISVDYFCFPSGDYGERELSILRASDYKASVTVAPGVNRRGLHKAHELLRTEVTDKDTAGLFRLKLLGAFDFLHGLLHRRRQNKFTADAVAAQREREASASEARQ